MNGAEITETAMEYAKAHRKEIVAEIIQGCVSAEKPIAIFMAGSPGAGKTETSKILLAEFPGMLRIDADELRSRFAACGYTGDNSHFFQKPTSYLVHAVHDAALKQSIGFLMDGTFANASMAQKNIERSLKRERSVLVLFVYQQPKIAWQFVLKREAVEGRRILPRHFAQKFCAARAVANQMKEKFGGKITLDLLCKNIDSSNKFYKENIQSIDEHIPEKHTPAQILAEIDNAAQTAAIPRA